MIHVGLIVDIHGYGTVYMHRCIPVVRIRARVRRVRKHRNPSSNLKPSLQTITINHNPTPNA